MKPAVGGAGRGDLTVLLSALVLFACGQRSISPEDASRDMHPDRAAPVSTKVCSLPGNIIKVYADPRGNFIAALPADVKVHGVGISGAQPGESVAVMATGSLLGAVVSGKDHKTTVAEELALIRKSLTQGLASAGTIAQRASGTAGKSHEGFPIIREAIWEVTLAPAHDMGWLLTRLVAAILQRPTSELGVFPPAPAEKSGAVVVRISITLRPGMIVASASLLDSSRHDDASTDIALSAADLSNGTALARPDMQPVLECDAGIIQRTAVADIIWIIDESDSMNDNRNFIMTNANRFFNMARANGLDFRMGVAGMKMPAWGVKLGKFCSDAVSYSDGGPDRFLLASEQKAFSACVKNPPYKETGYEYGLTHGYWAIKRHLPREQNSPTKVRKDAVLAIIFVTDETAQELKDDGQFLGVKGFLQSPDYCTKPKLCGGNCTLSANHRSKLDSVLKPMVELLTDADAMATVHLIGGTCFNACQAEIPHGYARLAERLGGQIGDVCQADLTPTIKSIIDSIAAAASPRKLARRPISSTVVVENNGVLIPRSLSKGFQYSASSNALIFTNVKVAKGDKMVVAYSSYHKARRN